MQAFRGKNAAAQRHDKENRGRRRLFLPPPLLLFGVQIGERAKDGSETPKSSLWDLGGHTLFERRLSQGKKSRLLRIIVLL
jgi:hypothetical protein